MFAQSSCLSLVQLPVYVLFTMLPELVVQDVQLARRIRGERA